MSKPKITKVLTLSIVIPVYNEEDYLKKCLDSIAAQTTRPAQVIVIDNNSTDSTASIARSYSFVRLLREKRQHQSFAQITGFRAVNSEIIGRIDADTVLPKDWVRNIIDYFSRHPEVVAVTGKDKAYDVPLGRFCTWFIWIYHQVFSHLISGHTMLWGANCALRKEAFRRVDGQLLRRSDIWEDYDLSFCLAPLGKIRRIDGIAVGYSFRAAHKPFWSLVSYHLRVVRTFFLRTPMWRAVIFFCLWSTLILFYPIPLLDRFLLFLRNEYGRSRELPH